MMARGADEATIRKLDDEKQIAEILKKWEDAWNTHDMAASCDSVAS
jgi:hypothetical protein